MIHRVTALSFVFFLLLGGSAFPGENTRWHAQLPERLKQIRTVLIVPDVRFFEVSAGGVREPREEWSLKARELLVKNIMETLKGKGLESVKVGEEQAKDEGFRDARALYDAVSFSIRLHTSGGRHRFPEKVSRFEYAVGPLDEILGPRGADAALFLDAFDHVSTGGRKALMAVGMITGALVGAVPVPRSGGSYTTAALVDRTGDVLWFDFKGNIGEDMREAEGVGQTVKGLFADFPGVSR